MWYCVVLDGVDNFYLNASDNDEAVEAAQRIATQTSCPLRMVFISFLDHKLSTLIENRTVFSV